MREFEEGVDGEIVEVGDPDGWYQAELEDSELIFRGEVTSIEPKGEWEGETWVWEGQSVVEFSVVRVWKGPLASKITVRTFSPADQCGYRFEVGVEYLVDVPRIDTGVVTHCGWTEPIRFKFA
ncbi:MAG: hypothetical protein OXH38_08285, partial [Chloroflexi bacterium]|nr:hypothetical protein [Chloroflexota bacterium]